MLYSRGMTRDGRAIVVTLATAVVLGGVLARPGTAQDTGEEAVEYAAVKPLASDSLLLDGTTVGDLMVVVGERGHILRSLDQGVSWEQALVPTRRALTGVFFHDEDLGWAVGHDATILRTRDGGATWERLNYAPEEERPFLDVWFADDDNGIAIGAYGFFYHTADGGDSWVDTGLELVEESAESDDPEYDPYAYDYGADMHLNQVSVTPSGRRLYIAAEAGAVYRSDDGGATWISLPSPYEGSFFGTLALDEDSVLLFGLRGHLFRSDDAGESWRELPTGSQALLTDAVRLDDGTIIITGLAGTILVSTDDGQSFSRQQEADRQGLTSVLPDGGGGLLLLGEYGVTRVPLAEIIGGTRQ